jgi:hypothetical protein
MFTVRYPDEFLVYSFAVLEAVLKMSRAPPEQGARQRESAVYKGVHEHFELPRNAAMASAVVFISFLVKTGHILGDRANFFVGHTFCYISHDPIGII